MRLAGERHRRVVGQAGPLGTLPHRVPEFVSELHRPVDGFVDGTIDTLGSAVSDAAGVD
ncbi:hypothetical protein [Halobellus salinus]|uniref:hypothetical protein n=1 Tax=Halobellus salinus TaxID=931585 RepID=UPI00166977D6|nr:hypothetical protein [Halobellus salinus]SMP04779.1 hypothetical protein SAMN06265347_10220 [Halobellus salinus]